MPILSKKQLKIASKPSKNFLYLTKIANKSQDFNPEIILNLKHESVQLSSLFKRKIFAHEVQIKHKNVIKVGIDNGKMNITVNNLEMVDIKDRSKSWNESLGMNVSVQNSFDTPTSIRLGDPSKGTTNISAANNGRIVEQTTGPMLGKGTIIVGGKTLTDDSLELANVSRDIKKTQVVTTSQTLGGLGVNLTVRTDALTNPVGYFQEVAAAVNGFPKNLDLAGKRIGNAVSDAVDAGKEFITTGKDPIKDYQRQTAENEASLKLKRDNPAINGKSVSDIINNKDQYSAAEYKEALNIYTKYLATELGVDPSQVNLADSRELNEKTGSNGASKEGLGLSDRESNNVVINVDKTNVTDTKELIETTGHELGHNMLKDDESGAARTGDQITKAWDRENAINGETAGQGTEQNQADWLARNSNSATVQAGTGLLENIDNFDPLSIYNPGTDPFGEGQSYDKEMVKDMAKSKGKEAVIVEWGDKYGNNRVSGKELAKQINNMHLNNNQEAVVINYWGGKNSVPARKLAGEQTAEFVESYKFKKGETLDEIGYSHGGNVTNEFTQAYDGKKKLDTVVFLGNPMRSDHQFDWSDVAQNGKVINVYDTGDKVQKLGGNPPGTGGRILPGATNIPIYQTEVVLTELFGGGMRSEIKHIGPIKSHLNLDSAEIWEKYVDPVLTKPKVTSEKK